MGKTLSALVIMGVAVMMVFSLLPVYAGHFNDIDEGTCQGPWNGPFTVQNMIDTFPDESPSKISSKDKNGNHHICSKGVKGQIMFRDDNPIPR